MTQAPPRPRVPATGPAAAPGGHGKPVRHPRSVYRRRRIVAAVLLLTLLGAVAMGVLWLRGDLTPEQAAPPPPEPVPGATVIGPTPTPASTPVPRETATALQAALPDAVLQWALTEQVGIDLAETAAALNPASPPLEGYALTYSDGEQTATLTTSQWRTAPDAATAANAVAADGEILREQDVEVASSVVGRMVATTDGGSEKVVWTNGTLLLVLTAPSGDALAFYDAMGL